MLYVLKKASKNSIKITNWIKDKKKDKK